TALVNFVGDGTLRLEKMKISNDHGQASGVSFIANSSRKLHVSDSVIVNNGTSGLQAGIYLQTSFGSTLTATIERCVIGNNMFGIFADAGAFGTAGTIRALVTDSVVSGNANNG